MRRSTAFIALWAALLSAWFTGCVEDGATCAHELACANLEGRIGTCCATEADGTSTCWYEAPDGVTFICEPIEDSIRAGTYCELAVEELTAHCSE